jgi:hypothetical protein
MTTLCYSEEHGRGETRHEGSTGRETLCAADQGLSRWLRIKEEVHGVQT